MASQQQTAEQLFGAALDRSREERAAFLDHVCGNEPELRRMVDELLLADDRAGSFLEEAAFYRPSASTDITRASSAPGAKGQEQNLLEVASSGRFQPGQVIASRFTVVRFIARGGMGEVYEVEDRFLQSVHVALKLILPQIAIDAGSSHRFEQEVLLARKVTHPNLCPIYDIAHSQDPPQPFLFLTMKLLSGETLSARLHRRPLIGRNEAISIFRQMTAGLTAIHAAGVIHRDIKPTNVMLERSGSELCLFIMDFGLARLHESEATVVTGGLLAGTPGYLAPELLQGHRPTQATDIFALGVVFHQILTGDRPLAKRNGLSIEPSSMLDISDVPAVFVPLVREFLADDPDRRCRAFEQLQGVFDSRHSTSAWTSGGLSLPTRHVLTRRNFAVGAALTTCAVAGGVAWNWDRVEDLLHPLPRKRFVALLGWPPPPDARLKPMLLGVIDAIASELARAEAFDHDLFVIPQRSSGDITTSAQLNELRESLGANLVLAASGVPQAKELHLSLRVIDPTAARPLREKQIRVPLDQQTSLTGKAVRAAAELLGIARYQLDDNRLKIGTDNPDAYKAFQAAEALRKEENDTGLDSAIEKYKQAVEIDSRYAIAQSRLAWAYLRSYSLHGDPAAVALARENCESAISLNPNLADAHLALAWAYQQTGDRDSASQEMYKALSLDPSNAHTLIYQARFYEMNDEWSDAEKTFARVLKIRPNYWLAHNELGAVFSDQGKYAEALLEFRSASLAAPKNSLAFNNIGSIYLQLGKLSEATDNLKISFGLGPNDPAAGGLAAVYRIQGDYTEAIEYAQKAVSLNPSEATRYLELADCYAAARKFRIRALAAYKQASYLQSEKLVLQKKSGPGWMLLALCQVKAGQPAMAPSLIKKAETLNADDIDSQLVKVRTLELLGRRDEALSEVERCLSRGATVFQFESMPDLEVLRAVDRYKKIITSVVFETKSAL